MSKTQGILGLTKLVYQDQMQGPNHGRVLFPLETYVGIVQESTIVSW